MKTDAGRATAHPKAVPAASEPARRQNAPPTPSDASALSATRESTNGVDESPRMVAQREQIASTLRPRTAQPASPGNGAGTPVLQRDPGDEPLVEFVKKRGAHAQTAYDLLCQQVDVGRMQVTLLENYAGPVGDDEEPEVATAKAGIAETSAAVRDRIAALPEEASDARATAVALASTASIATSHELLKDWTNQVLAATSEVAMAQAKAAGMLVRRTPTRPSRSSRGWAWTRPGSINPGSGTSWPETSRATSSRGARAWRRAW